MCRWNNNKYINPICMFHIKMIMTMIYLFSLLSVGFWVYTNIIANILHDRSRIHNIVFRIYSSRSHMPYVIVVPFFNSNKQQKLIAFLVCFAYYYFVIYKMYFIKWKTKKETKRICISIYIFLVLKIGRELITNLTFWYFFFS